MSSTLSTACASRSALLARLFSPNVLWRRGELSKVVRIFGNLADEEVDDDDDDR